MNIWAPQIDCGDLRVGHSIETEPATTKGLPVNLPQAVLYVD